MCENVKSTSTKVAAGQQQPCGKGSYAGLIAERGEESTPVRHMTWYQA